MHSFRIVVFLYIVEIRKRLVVNVATIDVFVTKMPLTNISCRYQMYNVYDMCVKNYATTLCVGRSFDRFLNVSISPSRFVTTVRCDVHSLPSTCSENISSGEIVVLYDL